jgi:hypothetical protein
MTDGRSAAAIGDEIAGHAQTNIQPRRPDLIFAVIPGVVDGVNIE